MWILHPPRILVEPLLGGSRVPIGRMVSTPSRAITIATVLNIKTLLISTHEPPSILVEYERGRI